MKVKIKPCDTAFSLVVREANDWTCERCHTVYERRSQGLHNSHIFSRSHRTIRWCKENTQALCYPCHSWFGGNPADSGIWIIDLLGEAFFDRLREKRDLKVKVAKTEEKEIAKHYRIQHKIILAKRAKGQAGYIDFISYQ